MEINVKAIELKELWRRYKEDADESARERVVLAYSPSSVMALDELCTLSDASGDQVSLLDTIHDPNAPDPARVFDAGRCASGPCPSARSCGRALLFREPDPA